MHSSARVPKLWSYIFYLKYIYYHTKQSGITVSADFDTDMVAHESN